jgi:hypothetical protein
MAAALGLTRPGGRNAKKEKKVGMMPVMWEAEMWRDEKVREEEQQQRQQPREEGNSRVVAEKEWDEITPLAMLHFPPEQPPAGPKPIDIPTRPRLTGRALLRAVFRPDSQSPMDQLREAALNRTLTRGTLVVNEPALQVPPEGTEVVMGVMIAMPSEKAEEDRWYRSGKEDEDEEAHLPLVCLGVMPAVIGS